MGHNPLWYKDAVFYEVSVRAFCDSNGDGSGDLRGLTHKLDYLQTLGVTCLWLMPIFESPLRDDGYDISDYLRVLKEFGDVDDFKALIEAAHRRGICIIADLVLNHTSDQHAWFQQARADRSSPYRDYYVWRDKPDVYLRYVDDKTHEEKDVRVIFTDEKEPNWTLDEVAGQYFWHRFFLHQPDLNYDNPRVQEEMLDVARFWLKLGIDGFRADAVPYLFERDGTSCENLPETHAFLKKVRKVIEDEFPGCILLCEANQWPADVRAYFGDGDEFHMAFHFPIMPRIFMALKKGRVDDMAQILRETPAIPDNCQWCTFLRNHDELTLEMVTPQDREWMWQQYAPDPAMRRNLGIRRRLAPLLDNDRRKIELANSLLFTLIGSPILYYGDEIGMGDDFRRYDRDGVRTPMQWDHTAKAGFTTGEPFSAILDGDYGPHNVNVEAQMADPTSLLHVIQHMIAARKTHKVFGWGELTWLDAGTASIAAYIRRYEGESVLILNNLADSPQTAAIPAAEQATYTEILSGERHQVGATITLQPYQFMWLRREG